MESLGSQISSDYASTMHVMFTCILHVLALMHMLAYRQDLQRASRGDHSLLPKDSDLREGSLVSIYVYLLLYFYVSKGVSTHNVLSVS